MKDIGLKFKNKREENGLSIKEVSDDLKVKYSDVESLEEGNRDNFKDIIFLKQLISDYAKYLGFGSEQMLDEFNEYLFDQTSRISLEDIEKARDLKEESEKEKIVSPYTIEKKEKSKLPLFGGIILIVLLIVFFVSYYLVSKYVSSEDVKDEVTISYMNGGIK